MLLTKPNAMSTPSNDNPSETAASKIPQIKQFARERTQDALARGREYTQKNPLAVALGVFIAGAVVGVLLSQRERKPADPVQATREWLESALQDVADRLPNLKKQVHIPQSLVEQMQEVGRKVKWW